VSVRSLGVLLVLACVPSGARAQSPPPAAGAHVIAGELVRLDLVQRVVGIRVDGPEGRETLVAVGADVPVSSRGRRLALHELRTGERITVSCADDGGRHVARYVKVGARPAAVPSPR
jgi:hypothetical protein